MCNKWFNDEIFQSSSGGANLQPAIWHLVPAKNLQSTVNAWGESTSLHKRISIKLYACRASANFKALLSSCSVNDIPMMSPAAATAGSHRSYLVSCTQSTRGYIQRRLRRRNSICTSLVVICLQHHQQHLHPTHAAQQRTQASSGGSYSLTVSKLGKSRHS